MLHSPSLRQWQYLVSLAENRHFGRAAEACFVTQSTLSAGIQELETQLGAALVDRTKRKVVLTPLGEELAGRARELLGQAEDMVLLARAASVPLSGPLRLGVIPTISPFLLPRVLPSLRKRFPALRLFLREDLTARLVEQLQAGKLDLLLIALPYEGGALDTMTLFDDEFLVACREDHPLARRNSVKLDDLSEAPLLLLEDGHCLRDQALAFCATARGGITAAGTAFAASSLSTVIQMVASGYGVTLIPQIAADVEQRDARVKFLRLENPQPGRTIGLAFRKTSPRKADFAALGDAVKDCVLDG